MKQKIIIDGASLVIDLTFMYLQHLLIDVTCYEDTWSQHIASGVRYIEIMGTTDNGEKINGRFQIVDMVNDTYILKSIRE